MRNLMSFSASGLKKTEGVQMKKISRDMLAFYNDTIEILHSHMKNIIKTEECEDQKIIYQDNKKFDFPTEKVSPNGTCITGFFNNNNRYDSFESLTDKEMLEKYMKIKKNNFIAHSTIENLRLTVLNSLKLAKDKNNKEMLMYYHSVIHLVYLMHKTEMPFALKLSEWLDTNFAKDDTIYDALRGNFGRITEKIKEMEIVIEEFLKIERICKNKNEKEDETFLENFDVELDRNIKKEIIYRENNEISHNEETEKSNVQNNFLYRKISQNKIFNNLKSFFNKNEVQEIEDENEFYSSLKQNWIKKYGDRIPYELKNIFFGKYDTLDLHWAESLCYELIYRRRFNGAFIDDPKILKSLITEDNIFTRILLGNFSSAFETCDSFLRLVLFFTFPLGKDNSCSIINVDKTIIENSFVEIGKKLLTLDWRLAFKYIIISNRADIYFSHLFKSKSMDSFKRRELLDFARSKNLQFSTETADYCKTLIDNGDYITALQIIKEFDVDVLIDDELLKFCIGNYDVVKVGYIPENKKNEETKKFILLMGKLKALKQEELKNFDNNDFVYILSYKRAHFFSLEIIEKILSFKGLPEKILVSLLKFVYEAINYNYENKKALTQYRKKILEELIRISEENDYIV